MFKFLITPDDGESYEVVASTRDVARWEKTTKGASLHALETAYRMVDLYAVAFHAVTRTKLFAGSLREFEDSCDLVLLDDEESGPPDPTRPAAS